MRPMDLGDLERQIAAARQPYQEYETQREKLYAIAWREA